MNLPISKVFEESMYCCRIITNYVIGAKGQLNSETDMLYADTATLL